MVEVSKLKSLRFIAGLLVYLALLVALWFAFRNSSVGTALGPEFSRAFTSFALLLAPLWLFGFGAAQPLKRLSSGSKIAAASLLAVSYFAFAFGTPIFSWRAALIVIAFPVLLAAFLELPQLPGHLTWRDAAALAIIVGTYYFKWLQSAWPPELAALPKLFLADVALYCFLVVRDVGEPGYSLIPTPRAFVIGIREWAFFFPIALLLGELTGFIHFHPNIPHAGHIVALIVLTFLLIAIPEELFFRAIIQNMLETRLGRTGALFTAAVLFGLSHFNHGARFNWRYVVLASIAGIFYGRAWRTNRQILASIITHTAVDVVWSLWFR